ncbi:11792_t:CDS:2 [Dentiscutata erythropus]|uniref:11792_t:CDS:1 n=1 Tax=Dentiscutata erythropus TaxID=1348616 RepID=A0A9N9EG02_9GLOM|nr:11792_t:CDS:2 [Dentiscutata erythropus]
MEEIIDETNMQNSTIEINDALEKLTNAIKSHDTCSVQEAVNNCLRSERSEDMSALVDKLPQLAIQYPEILEELLEKFSYKKLPENWKIKWKGCFINTSSKKVNKHEITNSPNYYIYLPHLFAHPKRGNSLEDLLKFIFIRKFSPFEELAYLRSIETFRSPIFESIVMYMYHNTDLLIFYLIKFIYYFIHFILFVSVIINTSSATAGNKNLIISSLFFGLIMLLIWFTECAAYFRILYYMNIKNINSYRSYIFKGWDVIVGLAASVLPVVTLSLELHNNYAPPELRSLSIFFMWIFIILQFRFFENVGIFIAVFEEIIWEIKWFLLYLIFIIFAFSHSLMVLLLETKSDDINDTNTFATFDQSLKNIWLILLGNYDSLDPWTNNRLLDIFTIIFSFSTVIVILNSLIVVLMNNAHEKIFANARAVWVAQLAEVIVDIEYSKIFAEETIEYIYNFLGKSNHVEAGENASSSARYMDKVCYIIYSKRKNYDTSPTLANLKDEIKELKELISNEFGKYNLNENKAQREL